MKGLLKISIILTIVLTACEDRIFPELNFEEPILVVDAWLTNEPGNKHIFLTRTRPYFDNSGPEFVRGADVTVRDSEGNVFEFMETDTGSYTYIPPQPSDSFGSIGTSYELSVFLGGLEYRAFSEMRRVPEIDSIILKLELDEDFFPDSAYFGEFFARDFEGPGDTYWIRAYKNGQYLNRPNEINAVYDAGFSAGGNIDGLIFIPPIRDGVNAFEEDPEDDNNFLSPYQVGDSIFVEIYSITNEVFDFLSEVQLQTDRPGGFAEIFAQPLANVPTNIEVVGNENENVLGMFSVSAVKSSGKTFTEEDVRVILD
jgi:hypothetical protein